MTGRQAGRAAAAAGRQDAASVGIVDGLEARRAVLRLAAEGVGSDEIAAQLGLGVRQVRAVIGAGEAAAPREAVVAEVVRRRKAGQTLTEIATALRLSRGCVSGIISRAGLSVRHPDPTTREHPRYRAVVALMRDGVGQRTIAERFGLTRAAVARMSVLAREDGLLTHRPRSRWQTPSNRPVVITGRGHKPKRPTSVAPTRPPVPVDVVPVVPGPDAPTMSLLEIGPRDCRWPTARDDSRPAGERWRFCGAPTESGAVYCPGHMRRAGRQDVAAFEARGC